MGIAPMEGNNRQDFLTPCSDRYFDQSGIIHLIIKPFKNWPVNFFTRILRSDRCRPDRIMIFSRQIFSSPHRFLSSLIGPAFGINYASCVVGSVDGNGKAGDQIARWSWRQRWNTGDSDKAGYWACNHLALRPVEGSADAQRSPGWICANGKGVQKKDDKLAAYWLNKSGGRRRRICSTSGQTSHR